MKHVFVYGSLLFPEIVKGLTGYLFETQEAKLSGYKRCSVKGADYPAIIKKKGSFLDGKVLLNVDTRSFEVLRFFEGNEYRCEQVQAKTMNRTLDVCVFVWVGPCEMVEKTDWNPNYFERHALADYVNFIIPETVEEFDRLFP